AEFQRALAQAATGDDPDCVRGAAIDFDEGDETLAIFSPWIIDAQLLQTEHCEPHAQHLSGTEMAVSLFRVAKIFIEGFHDGSFHPSDVSLTPGAAAHGTV